MIVLSERAIPTSWVSRVVLIFLRRVRRRTDASYYSHDKVVGTYCTVVPYKTGVPHIHKFLLNRFQLAIRFLVGARLFFTRKNTVLIFAKRVYDVNRNQTIDTYCTCI